MDGEGPPRLSFPVVGMGASAGGLEAFTEFLETVPADCGMAFVLVQHLPPDRDSLLAEILSRHTPLPVRQIVEGMAVEINTVYVTRPGHLLTLERGVFRLGALLDRPMLTRPIDDFFKSLAAEQRERAIAVILAGMGSNGSAGAQSIKAVGGLCIAQDPTSTAYPSMPQNLVQTGNADYILRPQEMFEAIQAYAEHPYTQGRSDSVVEPQQEQQHVRNILAILRERGNQNFSGYKKATLLRRIQRRMGLNQVHELADYTKFIRQNPAELGALADDLLIHVTGFFRDPEAWEQLRLQVIVPLVAARQPDQSIRCWVAACATGEEAYTLAMLLVEEAARVEKPLDIKVFATDMAQRTLHNARQGVYPGGIEAEITPERLERFFLREDAVYRVRPELRERLVFAPQNILHDPPFSRLDIVTCRNLLIYLETDIQQRVLALVHFGLRDGGVLFLGTSETVGDADGLFEAIDRKSRIFRRVGPTRLGALEFPVPALGSAVKRVSPEIGTAAPSLGKLATQTLLEYHTPAAVVVDRDLRILYFHGATELFLTQPRGEATRELMSLVREGLRGVVQTALQRAAAQKGPATVLHGRMKGADETRRRVAITASPLDSEHATECFVISFHDQGEESATETSSPEDGVDATELSRMRDELQSTIEELQASNEQLKASHEETVSINEELQSTNEELETGREEMQSLNEELTTVNAQLHAKMDELQAASSDLTSLLTSTDIAVLFLDTQFRIRRYTPAVRELLELISSDVGRPLSNLALKFEDPRLLTDAEIVLESLASLEREIVAAGGRWYLRRILPYRTADNRIDGVVITFLEITERKLAAESLTRNERRFRELSESQEKLMQARSAALNVLHDIAMFAYEAATVDQALQSALTRICAGSHWKLGHAWIMNEDETKLTSSRLWANRFEPDAAAQMGLPDFRKGVEDAQVDLTDPFAGRVASTGEAVWLEDIGDSAVWSRPNPARFGLRSGIALPLPVSFQNKVMAVLEFFSDETLPRDEVLLEIAPNIAVKIGHVFERQRLHREIAEIADREQHRMGQEMHDGLSQQIAGISFLAEGLEEKLRQDNSPLADRAAVLHTAAEEAKTQARKLIRGILPVEVAPEGLMHALQELADGTHEQFQIDCTLVCPEAVLVENTFIATHLYRIAKEAVHNAVKHASARRIEIRLRKDKSLSLQILDDGAGLDQEQMENASGAGLRIMRHRAHLIGAVLSIESNKSQGTCVSCAFQAGESQ